MEMERSIELRDPGAFRALAHPRRIALLGLLRIEGPLTATQAAALLPGESSGSCSYHLRQLARYGLVEEAPGGKGRQRPWRATSLFTSWPDVAPTPELAAATTEFELLIAEHHFARVARWIVSRSAEPVGWQEAASFGDVLLYLTPPELAALRRDLERLAERYLERVADPALRPKGSRPVLFLQIAVPAVERE
jgi:DNA-binding transcriptional ArsR family regulator